MKAEIGRIGIQGQSRKILHYGGPISNINRGKWVVV
jgi:hypothetical protein